MRGPRTPPPPPGSERRQHPRYEVLAQVEISGNEATLVLPVRDISAGGISVGLDDDGSVDFRLGDRVAVFLDAGVESDGRPLHVTVDAEVVRLPRGDGGRDARPTVAFRWVFADPAVSERFALVLDYMRKRGVPAD